MLFEEILFMLAGGVVVFFMGIPIYKFVKTALPQKRDRLAEAKVRLETAKVEAEAAKLEKPKVKIVVVHKYCYEK